MRAQIPLKFTAKFHWYFFLSLSFLCVCAFAWCTQTILFDAFHGDENIEMIECNFRLISGEIFVSKEMRADTLVAELIVVIAITDILNRK